MAKKKKVSKKRKSKTKTTFKIPIEAFKGADVSHIYKFVFDMESKGSQQYQTVIINHDNGDHLKQIGDWLSKLVEHSRKGTSDGKTIQDSGAKHTA